MFENIIKFFRKKGKKGPEELASKDMAKERLHLVLMQDRANVSADFLELMKQEIIEVIKKYIDVDENEIDVRLTNKVNDDGTTGAPALYANIPVTGVKEELKKEAENKEVNILNKSDAAKDSKEEKKKDKKVEEAKTEDKNIEKEEKNTEEVEKVEENIKSDDTTGKENENKSTTENKSEKEDVKPKNKKKNKKDKNKTKQNNEDKVEQKSKETTEDDKKEATVISEEN